MGADMIATIVVVKKDEDLIATMERMLRAIDGLSLKSDSDYIARYYEDTCGICSDKRLGN